MWYAGFLTTDGLSNRGDDGKYRCGIDMKWSEWVNLYMYLYLYIDSQWWRVCADWKTYIPVENIPLGKEDWSFASLWNYHWGWDMSRRVPCQWRGQSAECRPSSPSRDDIVTHSPGDYVWHAMWSKFIALCLSLCLWVLCVGIHMRCSNV